MILEKFSIPVKIKRYDGKYLAGADGHIYCFSNANCYKKKEQPVQLKEHTGDTGYKFVTLIKDGKRKSKSVHSLICSAFYGERLKEMCCRHLDGNKLNNLPTNLTWGTYSENEADKRRHGRTAMGEKQGKAILTEDAVRIIRASIPFGLWNSKDAAEVFGVTQKHIMSIAGGRDWKHLT